MHKANPATPSHSAIKNAFKPTVMPPICFHIVLRLWNKFILTAWLFRISQPFINYLDEGSPNFSTCGSNMTSLNKSWVIWIVSALENVQYRFCQNLITYICSSKYIKHSIFHPPFRTHRAKSCGFRTISLGLVGLYKYAKFQLSTSCRSGLAFLNKHK